MPKNFHLKFALRASYHAVIMFSSSRRPITHKPVLNERNSKLEYCLSSMQGYRPTVDDTHVMKLLLDQQTPSR
ncbi:unnamed protein product [Didymodactylos carnosus]|uniref:Uncharacterized protein n=1 Tax=Didymodactylos carnosus TaxID=1234261 RepID=A0A814WEJ5_9BILA|nr:unnamed protein product [Didymodactylos carnosus]CAF1201182.1 unnamed protein product [Didymodactylos carnosus]CAF3733199.1 unnamed protein product [Didymodactylos carnosus]CAF3965704.1 unnamed protein product [Didymodactylos carnosus]